MTTDTAPAEPQSPNYEDVLDAQTGDRLIAALNAKIGDAACDLCGTKDWALNASLASPAFVSVDKKQELVGSDLDTLHPCALLHCKNCGNSKLISLVYLNFDLFGKQP